MSKKRIAWKAEVTFVIPEGWGANLQGEFLMKLDTVIDEVAEAYGVEIKDFSSVDVDVDGANYWAERLSDDE